MRLRGDGAELDVLDSGISGGYLSERQSLVQESHHLGRMLSCFVDAPAGPYRQRRSIADAQGLSRQHSALKCPGFVPFLLS